MPVFKYQAREPMGKVVRKTINAVDMRAAMRELLSQGKVIAWIKPQNSAMLDDLGPVLKPIMGIILALVAAYVGWTLFKGNHH